MDPSVNSTVPAAGFGVTVAVILTVSVLRATCLFVLTFVVVGLLPGINHDEFDCQIHEEGLLVINISNSPRKTSLDANAPSYGYNIETYKLKLPSDIDKTTRKIHFHEGLLIVSFSRNA